MFHGHVSPLSGLAAERPRLGFISYPPLSHRARGIVAEFAGRAEIEVVEASFDSAVAAALQRERDGTVDAFVSAGSNARLLRSAVASPVAIIDIDGYDILLALLQARQWASRVGVVTYDATIEELDRVKDLLNIEVEQRAYRSPDEARACVAALAAQGICVIVGSSIAVEMARQHGLRGVLAYSQPSIRKGIETGLEMARVARLESARHEQVYALLRNLREAVVAVDGQGRITAANAAMETLLGRPLPALRGQSAERLVPELKLADTLASGSEDHGRLIHLGRREWIANRTPLREHGRVIGALAALYDVNDVETADSRLRAQRKHRSQGGVRHRFADLQGRSPALQHAVETALRYAPTDLTVLITGETGTGKEMFAQAMHDASARSSRPFVALNCSALPEPLLESELFGHEEGAFTGSRKGGKPGLFELAHTGTVFLDEIGDMPLALQSRLLRVLQEREVMRLGGSGAVPVDVRVMAATHCDLARMIGGQSFRRDLYYRLNTLHLHLPPLRERGDDVALLAADMLQRQLRQLDSTLPAAVLVAALQPVWQRYDWPGNVRELENICVRIAVFAASCRSAAELPLTRLLEATPELNASHDRTAITASRTAAQVLSACGGNRQRAAAALGISRSTLWRRLRSEGG